MEDQIDVLLQLSQHSPFLSIKSKCVQSEVQSVKRNACSTTALPSPSPNNPQNLPHFPVPVLHDTLKKFLKTAIVHLSPSELEATKTAIENFESGIGKKLQNLLEQQAKIEENWLASRWLNTAYMQYRDPVCVYSSPGMFFPTKKFHSIDEFLQYTAKIVHGALKYKQLIDEQKIPLEKMGKHVLDMSQYGKVFGTCRIPGLKEDHLEYYPNSKHVAVVYNNNFYKVPIYDRDGCILPLGSIVNQLKLVYLDRKERSREAVGILSSNDRNSWGIAYKELTSNPLNKESVREVQESLFVVCLDQEVPIQYGVNDMTVGGLQLIHGGGSLQNAGNRWFDKTIQVIVNRNGTNGLCYEHAPAEGQPIANMTDYIFNSLNNVESSEKSAEYETPVFLPFDVSACLSDFIQTASVKVDKLAQDLHLEVLHFKEYGKEFIKNQKLSPDSYIQMAMQYAFYKLHRSPAAHYESAHLRMYVNGRTETIRSCSVEAINWANSMNESSTDAERVRLLREAVNAHRDYTLMALEGKGVDRHLLGLKLMALENNIPIPQFYQSPGVIKSAHMRLSTSQVASKYPAFMCYGPLVNDGYGCCYNPRSNDMIFAISSWRSNNKTDTERFMMAMRESLVTMAELLHRAGEKPKAKL